MISYISRVRDRASAGVPPTKSVIAGAAAIAKPPRPVVSVIVLSPMSGAASSSSYSGKYRPSTLGAGAVNHRSSSPLIRMPNSVPFRVSVVTIVDHGTPDAASTAAFPAAIERLR